MSIPSFLKNLFYKRRLKKCGLRFPVLCKIRGVKVGDRQGALAQSGGGDELQLVHSPVEGYPFNVYVYSITLNRVLGYLDANLSEKLVYLFGNGFCRDGEIESITGGPPTYPCYGCNIRILESMTMINGYDELSHLRGE